MNPTRSTSLDRYAKLAMGTAIFTMTLKGVAWGLTGSVGLLSDALESIVNLASSLFAFISIRVASKPPDDEHHFGHEKAEYFASGAIGMLLILSAVAIALEAIDSLIAGKELRQVDLGILLVLIASIVNGAVGRRLIRVGKREGSMALESDGHHLMTDVWTSVGIGVGIALAVGTGWHFLDPAIALVIAMAVGINGYRILRRSSMGLMDTSLPQEELSVIEDILHSFCQEDKVSFHALRTRRSGTRDFVSFHVQVPGCWTVQDGHDLLEDIEATLRTRIERLRVFTHLEPREDPRSWEDANLDRAPPSRT